MPAETHQPIKIIITDDQSIFRTGIRNSLATKNDIVIIAEAVNGQDLLDKLEYLQPDIILLNIQMPVLDGLDTLPILKKKYPAIKVIILSFLNQPEVICQMIKLGANAYVTKERGADEVYEAILFCHKNWLYINDLVRNALTDTKVVIPENPPYTYTIKEINILKLLDQGKTISEIGIEINLMETTVKAFIDRLKSKTNTRSVETTIEFARSNKII